MLKNHNLKDKTLWLVFAVFLIITVWAICNHSPWRDEAQSWLLIRDLNLPELINQMPYEGTPPLWHLLVYPLAKLNLPYVSQSILHYLLALSSVFILIFFSPLPKKAKLILPFTYYLLFEYIVIARNYNLTALLLFIIASIYSIRFKRPILYASLLFLLAWTNVHSLAMAFLLTSLFIYDLIKKQLDNKKNLTAVFVMVSGIFSAILMLVPQLDQYSGFTFLGFRPIAQSLASALFPFFANPNLPIFVSIIVSLLWLPFIISLLKSWRAKIIFIIPVLWLEFIFLFKHSGYLRHYGLILIFFIFAWWLDLIIIKRKSIYKQSLYAKIILILFLVCLVINSGYAFNFFYKTNKMFFSGSQEMAQYLKDNNLDQEEIATYPSYSGSALLPYLPGKEFYQLDAQKKATFLTWNNDFFNGISTPYSILKNNLKYYYSLPENKVDSVLLLTTFPPEDDPELEFIFKNSRETVKQDEFFYLYRLQLE
ncbi:MAG TPA: hypothetical protein VFD51_00265 [Patescibacteria group bacterium]|nr:hypothetical protein [Patescibacteria group bacterium]